MTIEIGVLEPIEAALDGDAVELRGARQHRFLAKLAMHPGALVSGIDLIDALWPDGDLPADAKDTLRTYASRFRAALGGGEAVVAKGGGYLLGVPPAAVDATHFESLVRSADGAVDGARLGFLHEALTLWRGPAFSGCEHEDWARSDAVRLGEMHDRAVDDRAELLIDSGRHEEAVALLEAAALRRPLRERTHRLLMSAVQQRGRQGEALRA